MSAHVANPYPAGLAVFADGGQERILVASNLSDSVFTVDPQKGVVDSYNLRRRNGVVPSRFPYRVVVSSDAKTGWCVLWNDSSVAKLDLSTRGVGRRVSLGLSHEKSRTGSHPDALALSPDGRYLFVALATRDAIAILDAHSGRRVGEISTKLPGQNYEGVYPDALAFSADGKTLFVADAAADAVVEFNVPSQLGAASSCRPSTLTFPPSRIQPHWPWLATIC